MFFLPQADFQRAGPTDPDDEELFGDDDVDDELIESAVAASQQDTWSCDAESRDTMSCDGIASAADTSFTPSQVEKSPSKKQVKLNYVR